MALDLIGELEAVIAAFDREGIEYAICAQLAAGLDLLVVSPDLETVWAGRTAFDVGGRRMVVVSRDGLVMMKKLAGRPQDLLDIAKLEGRNDDDSIE